MRHCPKTKKQWCFNNSIAVATVCDTSACRGSGRLPRVSHWLSCHGFFELAGKLWLRRRQTPSRRAAQADPCLTARMCACESRNMAHTHEASFSGQTTFPNRQVCASCASPVCLHVAPLHGCCKGCGGARTANYDAALQLCEQRQCMPRAVIRRPTVFRGTEHIVVVASAC